MRMRIGTWNVDNWLLTDKHKNLIIGENCDVWLITELPAGWVNDRKFSDFHCHRSKGVMGRNQHWAAVLSFRPLIPLEDPHQASAAASVNGIMFCSTILPWRGSGGEHPWVGENHSARTADAITALLEKLPRSNLVWGGDWNHSLKGKEVAGSKRGRVHLLEAIKALNLQVPTTELFHRNDICFAIDHIGVPHDWTVISAKRIVALGLSDHDAYVIEVEIPDK